MVAKQHKIALNQAPFVFQRFIEQFVADVELMGMSLNIGIKQYHLIGCLITVFSLSGDTFLASER